MSITRDQSRPSHHRDDTASSFVNPWPSAGPISWYDLLSLRFPFSLYPSRLHNHADARSIKVVAPDWGAASLARSHVLKEKSLVGTWLGHATAFVELPALAEQSHKSSLYFLFDPIFSDKASPTQTTGATRFKPAPCQVADLPGCDAVFISHIHYDHLDRGSILALRKKFPESKYFVPLGIKSWLVDVGIAEEFVCELDWWDESFLGISDAGFLSSYDSKDKPVIKVTCVPAQHNSARSLISQQTPLWCGWVVERFTAVPGEALPSASGLRRGAVFHAGDTGYRRISHSTDVCPAFEEIGAKFGGFDLSFIPIWRGGGLSFISSYGVRLLHHNIPATYHASPADAINIHFDVKSKNTIGIHFGTFVGSENETNETIIEFAEACRERSVRGLTSSDLGDNGRAGLLDIGESLVVEFP